MQDDRRPHGAVDSPVELVDHPVVLDRRWRYQQAGGPKLFDFNQIPFTERPQNPFIGLALKLGLLGRESRDLRKLERFNNFDRVERKLLKFYKGSPGPSASQA